MDNLNIIFDELLSWFDTDILTTNEYDDFISLFAESIHTFYPDLLSVIPNLKNMIQIENQIKILNIKQLHMINIYDFNQKFIRCEDRDYFYDSNCSNPLVVDIDSLTIKQRQLFDQYKYLINLPQPVQKSKEWFDMRNNMITASNCGSVIGECKYTPIKALLIDKIGLGEKFRENKFVYHGKKYEKIAIMIYENIYNSKVGEFGLIQHPQISYLGASPDGISMSLTLDGKLNRLMGRMLEIKCPPARKIVSCGSIKGDICPDYYWVQVQIQLECCNLPECDFWQCHLTEYENETQFINDPVDDFVHSNNEIYVQDITTRIDEVSPKIFIDKRNRKGALIELLPIDRSNIPKGDLVEWYGKYIYPPTILINVSEYLDWINSTIKNINILYPELATEYKFSRVVYWKLQSSHNELIMRQPEWFESNKEYYRIFWNRVLYYRKNLDLAKIDLINKKISDKIFLNSTENRIETIEKDSIFIKPKSKSIIDEFLSSSDQKTKSKIVDEFLSSSEQEIKPKIKTKPIKDKKSIEKIKTLVYKNSANIDNTQIDLVMIENKKLK